MNTNKANQSPKRQKNDFSEDEDSQSFVDSDGEISPIKLDRLTERRETKKL